MSLQPLLASASHNPIDAAIQGVIGGVMIAGLLWVWKLCTSGRNSPPPPPKDEDPKPPLL